MNKKKIFETTITVTKIEKKLWQHAENTSKNTPIRIFVQYNLLYIIWCLFMFHIFILFIWTCEIWIHSIQQCVWINFVWLFLRKISFVRLDSTSPSTPPLPFTSSVAHADWKGRRSPPNFLLAKMFELKH